MRGFLVLLAFTSISTIACSQDKKPGEKSLFDGRSFAGWQGDTVKTWKVVDSCLAGGSLTEEVPHNEFLATTKEYKNFILRVKFRLTGTEGFINTGVQFHSKRLKEPAHEMVGYQADLGDGFWASLYDESRRNKTIAKPDSSKVESVLKRNEWNDYEVHSENGRIRIKLNGVQTIDYKETDPSIPQSGLIAFQIHGGGKALVYYKDIFIKELP